MEFEFLSHREAVVKRVIGELEKCKRAAWAIAWATEKSDVFRAAVQYASKFKFLVVGTANWISSPKAIAAMQNAVGDKFRVFEPDRHPLFHTKMGLFTDDVHTVAVIGSHNLTRGAFHRNDEACVAIKAVHGSDKVNAMW